MKHRLNHTQILTALLFSGALMAIPLVQKADALSFEIDGVAIPSGQVQDSKSNSPPSVPKTEEVVPPVVKQPNVETKTTVTTPSPSQQTTPNNTQDAPAIEPKPQTPSENVVFNLSTGQVSFQDVVNNTSSKVAEVAKGIFGRDFAAAAPNDFLFTYGKDNYVPVKKGDKTQYLTKIVGKGPKDFPSDIGYVNLKEEIPESHYSNPLNILVLAATQAEGNGILDGNVFFLNKNGMIHIDPGNQKMNVGGPSVQSSSVHSRVAEIAGGDDSLETAIKIFESNLWLTPGLEYTQTLIEALNKAPFYNQKSSLVLLFNYSDWIVQVGPGSAKDFIKANEETKNMTKSQMIDFLVKNGFGTSTTIDGKTHNVAVWPHEIQRILVTRLKIYKEFKPGPHLSRSESFVGIAELNAPGTYEQKAFRDQVRRVWAMRTTYSMSGFNQLGSAKISAFKE
ncbi:MAG: hypothetical protein ACRCXZ_01585 [Patescibacteria group bacterium]